MRKFLYGAGALLVLVLGTALLVPVFVDVNDYKEEIVAQVRTETGRDLVIDGPLSLSLLPSPVLEAEGVRFSSLPGAAEPDMAQIRSLQVAVDLLPLLSGQVDISRISLVGARIVLETLADGRANWEFSPAAPTGGPAAPAAEERPDEAPRAIAVRDLTIEDSTLIWRDAASGRSLQFDSIDARVTADTLQGPFDARIALESRGIPLTMELRTGDISRSAQPAFLSVKTGGGTLRFDGTASAGASAPTVSGSLRSDGDSLAAFVEALAAAAGQAPVSLPPAFAQKFAVEAAIKGDSAGLAAEGVKLTLGAESGEGSLAVRLGEPLRADVKLAFAKLDFDQLLATKSGPEAAESAEPRPSLASDGAESPTQALKDFEGSIDLSVGTIVYHGRTAQQVAVNADLSGGVLTLHRLGGQFPGSTVISAAGSVDAGKAQPSAKGKVEIRSARLRDFLSWVDVDVSRIAADRLNALDFTGQISATADGNVQIANAVAKVDSTTAKGAVTLRTSPRIGVVADLDIDTVNVDAYLPNSGTGSAATATPTVDGGGSPLDATVKARIARVTYHGNQIEGVSVDVTAAGDRLTFRPSRVASLAGASLAWNGTVSNYAANPSIDLTVDLQAQDGDRLLRLAGIASPLKNQQRLGALTARGRIAGRAESLAFTNFALGALGTSATLTGKFSDGAQGIAYDFSRVEARSDDADRLLAALGVAAPLPGRKLGAITVAGAAQGNATQATVDLDVASQGATFDLKGTVSGLDASPALAMNVGVRHPDFQRFMRLLSPEYGGGAGVGAIAFTARVDGDPARELRITNLRGNLGPAAVAGAVTANLAGAVPDIAVTLETGILEIDRILPLGQRADLPKAPLRDYPPNVVPASGGVQLAQAGARAARFARTPIDVSALRAVNARIDLKSQALSMPPWRVANAVGQIDLRGGVLTVSRLAGRAFSGDFLLTGALNAARLPASLNASLKATQMDMGELSRALSQKDRFDGRMDVALELNGNGSSEAELVSSLGGSGSLGGRLRINTSFAETAGGLLAGQAAQQLDKLLGNLLGSKDASIGGGDINAAIRVVLARFANRDGEASGTLQVRNGVVTSNDLRVQGNRARAETRMTANLPAWTLDATTNVLLDENPQQPYLIVVNRGALDDPGISISRGANVRAQDEPAQRQPAAPPGQRPGQVQQEQQPRQQQQQQQQQQQRQRLPSLKDLLQQR